MDALGVAVLFRQRCLDLLLGAHPPFQVDAAFEGQEAHVGVQRQAVCQGCTDAATGLEGTDGGRGAQDQHIATLTETGDHHDLSRLGSFQGLGQQNQRMRDTAVAQVGFQVVHNSLCCQSALLRNGGGQPL
ncbi:hypothetical protein D9M70_558520 [compost metagenome]